MSALAALLGIILVFFATGAHPLGFVLIAGFGLVAAFSFVRALLGRPKA